MGFIRSYFERQLPISLEESGITLQNYIVQPVSAKKGYGILELQNKIFQLRNAESNVYFLGIVPLYRGR